MQEGKNTFESWLG